jgi:hypothetical protein
MGRVDLPVIEMGPRNLTESKGCPAYEADNFTAISNQFSRKCGNFFNVSKSYGLEQLVNEWFHGLYLFIYFLSTHSFLDHIV